MYNVPIKHKKCATCRWWSGGRELVFVGANPQFVSVEAMADMKNCRAWEGRKFASTHTCFRWSKWEKM